MTTHKCSEACLNAIAGFVMRFRPSYHTLIELEQPLDEDFVLRERDLNGLMCHIDKDGDDSLRGHVHATRSTFRPQLYDRVHIFDVIHWRAELDSVDYSRCVAHILQSTKVSKR